MLEKKYNHIEVEKDKYNASGVANLLIKEEMYDIAFNMLIGTEKHSYELGLCYEKGYGTEVDLDNIPDWDFLIDNNKDYETLKRNVLQIVSELY